MKTILIILVLLLLPINVTWGGGLFQTEWCDTILGDNGKCIVKCTEGIANTWGLIYSLDTLDCVGHYEYYDSITDMFWVDTVIYYDLDVVYPDTIGYPNMGVLTPVEDTIITKHPILIPCSTLVCGEPASIQDYDMPNIYFDKRWKVDTFAYSPDPQPDPSEPKCDTVPLGYIGYTRVSMVICDYDTTLIGDDYQPKCDTVCTIEENIGRYGTPDKDELESQGYECYLVGTDRVHNDIWQEYHCTRCGE